MTLRLKLFAVLFGTLVLGTRAADLANTYKASSYSNPISPCVFCADPTAMEYNGRLYVYGTNDHQQFLANNRAGENNYGAIKSLVIFSTADMVNWTFHGTIDVAKICNAWGWRFAASWAPSVTWRENANGEPEFFLYFANSGGSVGVLKASSPTGPWQSPLSKPLIDGDTPGVKPCNWIFDPGVAIDDEGTAWLAFGGGDPNAQGTKLMPGNSRIAKLKPSMTALDGAAVNLPAPYLFEASELNIIGGRIVYTYNTSWSDRNDWSSYAKRGSAKAPSACSMCYMVTDTPLDPDSWEYRGEYLANPGTFGFGYGNNHTHLQKFRDNYYLFYHSMVLEQKMKTGASGFRSIGVDQVTVNEETQRISTAKMTNQGPAATDNMNPYDWQQAETMATAGGVSYEDFKNASKATCSNLGNDASVNLQVQMKAGSWTMVRNADFGSNGAASFTLRASGNGTLEVRVGKLNATAAATVTFSSAEQADHTVEIAADEFSGTQNIFFVFTEADNVKFDAWQFAAAQPDTDATGIKAQGQGAKERQKATDNIYNLNGQKLNTPPARGIYIRQGQKLKAK